MWCGLRRPQRSQSWARRAASRWDTTCGRAAQHCRHAAITPAVTRPSPSPAHHLCAHPKGTAPGTSQPTVVLHRAVRACSWPAGIPILCSAVPHRPSPCHLCLQVLTIPANLSDAQLREALAPHSGAQLLHFASLDGAFGKWEKQEDRDALQASGPGPCAGQLPTCACRCLAGFPCSPAPPSMLLHEAP